jgi:uridine kinase
MNKTFIIGVAGGSGSGKTTLAQEIKKSIPTKNILHIKHDSYYRDQSHLSMEQRQQTNYDHPDSLETDLLITHLNQLCKGESVLQPVYDFTQHTRSTETVKIEPKKIILVEGILIFADEKLRELMDLRIYVDTQADVRLARRLVRDVAERGRTFEYGLEQYLQFTKPMHDQFVEPSKRFAHVILPEGGLNTQATSMIQALVRSHILNSKK